MVRMRLSNIEVSNQLGMSQSTISRMRKGERLASPGTLYLIAQTYNVEPGILLNAASKAKQGDRNAWIILLNTIFDDGEPDPSEGLDDPEEAPVTPAFSH